MTLIPLDDKVIVKRDEGDNKTPGGIILPDIAKNKPETGVVVAVGPGRWNKDQTARVKINLSVGQRVAFVRYAGHEIEHDDEKLLVLTEENVLAIITK